jgi:hypothetical protein
MSLEIQFEQDLKKLKKHLDWIARGQIPYATAMALNTLAEEARLVMMDEFNDELNISSQGQLKKGISTQRAKKRDWPLTESKVGILEKFEYLSHHIEGKIRRAETVMYKDKKMRAIPVPGVIKKKVRGRVYPSQKPKALLAKKSFIFQAKSGKFLLGKRKTKKRLPLLIQYKLIPEAKIDAVVEAEKRVRKLVTERYDKVFGTSLAKAIKSSKYAA